MTHWIGDARRAAEKLQGALASSCLWDNQGAGSSSAIANKLRGGSAGARPTVRGRFVSGGSSSMTTMAERFWAKVDTTTTPDGCWEWMGARPRSSRAYGRFFDGERVRDAHRVALELHLGRPIRPGFMALHSCDNKWCVRPAHLSEGTRARNTAEAVDRGRIPAGDGHYTHLDPSTVRRGEAHHAAVLNADDVRAIRDAYAAGQSQTSLGRAYGVNRDTIGRIVRRQNWKSIP